MLWQKPFKSRRGDHYQGKQMDTTFRRDTRKRNQYKELTPNVSLHHNLVSSAGDGFCRVKS